MAKKWQNDPAFCAWLDHMEYQAISEGLKIYCWEAFCAGRRIKRKKPSLMLDTTKSGD